MNRTAERPINPTRVRQRVRDWEQRLNSLYDDVEAWARSDSRLPQGKRGTIVQRNEEMLERFGVQPRSLPTLTYLFDGNRIAFTPSALWTVSANGHVNLAINDNFFSLIDLGGEDGRPSDWRLSGPSSRQNLVKFTASLFRRILDQAL